MHKGDTRIERRPHIIIIIAEQAQHGIVLQHGAHIVVPL